MAPTEVLAEQHAAERAARCSPVSTVPEPDNLFGDRPLRVELLTNRVTGADAPRACSPASPTAASTSPSARTR